jgi:hypothetical protein
MFEHRRARLMPWRQFLMQRVLRFASISALIIGSSLLLGASGYHWIAGLDWVDALLNATMILTGMGPVTTLHTDSAKLFATGYALFSGVVFLSTIAVLWAPVIHRFLHVLHLEEAEAGDELNAS